MTLSIASRGPSIRIPVLPVSILLALFLGAVLPGPPARAGDDGEWSIEILAQSDSHAELRPCT